MRLGLFGGTFDPIHLGHLILAEQCREACGLDRVWFVVAGAPPHKPGERTPVAAPAGDGPDRDRRATRRSRSPEIEARRPGPHYSVETLEDVHRERPDDELFFLIGADSLVDLPPWRQPERIARLATIVVVNRPGIDPPRTRRPARLRPRHRTRCGRSRSPRSASPRTTSAGGWPRAGASATRSRAGSRRTSRRRGFIERAMLSKNEMELE